MSVLQNPDREWTNQSTDIWLRLALPYNKYLLLAEFSVRTVNYRPSFFASIYDPSEKRAGHKSMEKNEDP